MPTHIIQIIKAHHIYVRVPQLPSHFTPRHASSQILLSILPIRQPRQRPKARSLVVFVPGDHLHPFGRESVGKVEAEDGGDGRAARFRVGILDGLPEVPAAEGFEGGVRSFGVGVFRFLSGIRVVVAVICAVSEGRVIRQLDLVPLEDGNTPIPG